MDVNNIHFTDICFKSGLPYICIFGFVDIFIGLVFLVFNCYAFIKMTKFFGQICFENMMVLLSMIQLILFLIEMVLFNNLLIYLFTFLQIIMIFLINNKFNQISKGIMELKYTWINKVILIINICYFVGLIILNFVYPDLKHVNYVYYFIELFAAILLTFYCCKFLNIIKRKLYKKRLQSEISTDIVKNTKKINEIKNMYFFNLFYFDSEEGNETFYTIKRKQLTLLYLCNIICTVFECSLEICVVFININDIQNQLMIYIYYLVSLIHNIIIFFSFYWVIRGQFNSDNLNLLYNDDEETDEGGLIDDKFIEEEVINIQKEKKLNEEKSNKESKGRISNFTEDFEYLN